MTNRVILIDDHELLLRGLTLIFDTIDECEVVATTTNGKKVSSLIDAFAPDIVVTDAVMPDFDGLAVVRECATHYPHVPVLVLTTFDDATLVRSLIDAGAAGYLLKDIDANHLAEAIDAAAGGGIVLDPRIARMLHRPTNASCSPSSKKPASVEGITTLTRAERKVATLVAEGKNNKEIAEILYLAEGTVKNHVSVLLRKMKASDRTVLALTLARAFGQLD